MNEYPQDTFLIDNDLTIELISRRNDNDKKIASFKDEKNFHSFMHWELKIDFYYSYFTVNNDSNKQYQYTYSISSAEAV